MAVENDYNLLVHNLNELAKTISILRDEVQSRRLREAEQRLQPNETDWVNLIGAQLQSVDHVFTGLRAGVREVLGSEPGIAVFSAQPPAAPDQPNARRGNRPMTSKSWRLRLRVLPSTGTSALHARVKLGTDGLRPGVVGQARQTREDVLR